MPSDRRGDGEERGDPGAEIPERAEGPGGAEVVEGPEAREAPEGAKARQPREAPERARSAEPPEGIRVADLEAAAKRGVRTRLFTVLLTLVLVLVLSVLAGLWVLGTGAYDVAATEEHAPITRWMLNTLQHRSVAARAELPVAIPDDPAAIDHGFEHFHAMCVECHGAPGYDRGEIGEGMNPTPPRLEEEAHEWTDAELFRITKHGIRLAGMPAFGPTHGDEEIAGIVAFIRVMESMTEEEYAEMVRALQAGEAMHEH